MLLTWERHLQMRISLAKLVTTMQSLKEADGELAATGGGDDGTAPMEEALQRSRGFGKTRIGFAAALAMWRTRPW